MGVMGMAVGVAMEGAVEDAAGLGAEGEVSGGVGKSNHHLVHIMSWGVPVDIFGQTACLIRSILITVTNLCTIDTSECPFIAAIPHIRTAPPSVGIPVELAARSSQCPGHDEPSPAGQ